MNAARSPARHACLLFAVIAIALCSGARSQSISYFSLGGTATYVAPPPPTQFANAAAVADFDADGTQDVVGLASTGLAFFHGLPQGGFAPAALSQGPGLS